jgi:hypothetical protein
MEVVWVLSKVIVLVCPWVLHGVLVSLVFYNKIPWTGWYKNSRNLFLTVLEAGSPRSIKADSVSGEVCFLEIEPSCLYLHMLEGVANISFIRSLISSIIRALQLWSNHLSRALPPISSPRGEDFHVWILEGLKHSDHCIWGSFRQEYQRLKRREIPLVKTWLLMTLFLVICSLAPRITCDGKFYITLTEAQGSQTLDQTFFWVGLPCCFGWD